MDAQTFIQKVREQWVSLSLAEQRMALPALVLLMPGEDFLEAEKLSGHSKHIIPYSRFLYFAAADYNTNLVARNEEGNPETYFLPHTLKYYAQLVGKESFFRIHHHHLICLAGITPIFIKDKIEVLMPDGVRLPVARRRNTLFKKAFYRYRKGRCLV